MLIIPAIDLKDGACVRLRQGRMEDSTVFSDDPVSMAAKWVEGGCRRLHLVDLNGAFEGQPVNGEVVTAIAKRYPTLPIQIGGGIRTLETIEHYVRAGVSYVIIGTKAVKEPEFVRLSAGRPCGMLAGHHRLSGSAACNSNFIRSTPSPIGRFAATRPWSTGSMPGWKTS